MHAKALLSDICNNAMSAGVLVCRELQQSGQLLLRVAANGCVFQAAGGGGAGGRCWQPGAAGLQHEPAGSGEMLGMLWSPPPPKSSPQEPRKGLGKQLSCRQMACP